MKEVISTNDAPKAIGPYSQANKIGNLVFVSGQLPLDPVSGELASGIEAQAHQSLKNLAAILNAAGFGMGEVVKTTLFLKDMANFKAVNEVYGMYFQDGYPARSTVQVARLPLDAEVEIEAVAAKKD